MAGYWTYQVTASSADGYFSGFDFSDFDGRGIFGSLAQSGNAVFANTVLDGIPEFSQLASQDTRFLVDGNAGLSFFVQESDSSLQGMYAFIGDERQQTYQHLPLVQIVSNDPSSIRLKGDLLVRPNGAEAIDAFVEPVDLSLLDIAIAGLPELPAPPVWEPPVVVVEPPVLPPPAPQAPIVEAPPTPPIEIEINPTLPEFIYPPLGEVPPDPEQTSVPDLIDGSDPILVVPWIWDLNDLLTWQGGCCPVCDCILTLPEVGDGDFEDGTLVWNPTPDGSTDLPTWEIDYNWVSLTGGLPLDSLYITTGIYDVSDLKDSFVVTGYTPRPYSLQDLGAMTQQTALDQVPEPMSWVLALVVSGLLGLAQGGLARRGLASRGTTPWRAQV